MEDRKESNGLFQGQEKIMWQLLHAMKPVPESTPHSAGEEMVSDDPDSTGEKRMGDLDDPGSDLEDPLPEEKATIAQATAGMIRLNTPSAETLVKLRVSRQPRIVMRTKHFCSICGIAASCSLVRGVLSDAPQVLVSFVSCLNHT